MSLKNVILEGALIHMAENTSDPAQMLIHTNVKKYVEMVHHQAFGPEFMNGKSIPGDNPFSQY